mgnify:CR=1 FL=1
MVPGADPTHTALTEYYEVPWNNPNAKVQGFSPRGLDIDRNGVVWTVLASGHMASFDRSKCEAPLNGPNATGQHCLEGWTLHESPGPKFKGGEEYGSADSNYHDWELFKVRNGKLLRIEALVTPVPYGVPTGWGGKPSHKE